LHELATNAAKYGSLSVPDGNVHIEAAKAADGTLFLRWAETGGPPVKQPERRGFGSRVIDAMIRNQSGEIRFDWRAEGLVCEITIPARG
jgi:two-component sensor histidine kinase